MFLKSLAAKALFGAGALGIVGGSAAAASATLPMQTAAAPSPQGQQATNPAQRDLLRGLVQSVSDKRDSMVVETRHRDPNSHAVSKDDVTVFLTATTRVVRWSAPRQPLGLDAIKAGERVRVRYSERDGNKYANRVVLLPDVRAGKVLSKSASGFTIQTKDGRTITVAVTDKTRYFHVVGRRHREAGSFAALQVGNRVVVLGQAEGNGTFDAAVVAYRQPAAKG